MYAAIQDPMIKGICPENSSATSTYNVVTVRPEKLSQPSGETSRLDNRRRARQQTPVRTGDMRDLNGGCQGYIRGSEETGITD